MKYITCVKNLFGVKSSIRKEDAKYTRISEKREEMKYIAGVDEGQFLSGTPQQRRCRAGEGGG